MKPEGDQPTRAVRTVAPAYTLFSTARYALEKAQRTTDRAFLELLTANLMVALAFEATLNHIGAYRWGVESEVWAAVERLSPIAKLKAIAEVCHFDLDLGERPAQTMVDVHRFRNAIVHGKTQFLEGDLPQDMLASGLSFPDAAGFSAKWEQKCTLDFAQRAIDDLLSLSEQLADCVGITNPTHMGELREWPE
jgi:hypothetical protein